MKTRSLLLGLACWLATPAAVLGQDLSGIPAAFVDVGFGARPVALGNAYVAFADDAHAVFWNPAGLATDQDIQVALSYIDQLGLFSYQHLAARVPLPGALHGLGLGLISTGDDALQEISAQVGYARALGSFYVGLNVKYRYASFGNNALDRSDYEVFEIDEFEEGVANQVQGQASGFGLDVGLLYQASPQLSFGMALRDAFAPVQWDSQGGTEEQGAKGSYSERLPRAFAVGTVYRVRAGFSITADYTPSLYKEVSDVFRLGVETQVLGLLSLRGGMQQFINNLSDEKYALGFGLNVPLQELRFVADYTFQIEQLGNSQHISLALTL